MVRAATAPPLRRVGTFRVGSRSKLTPRDAPHFASLPPLLGEVADAVSSAACLPRKELFEAWEVATRIDAAFPSASRVADLAAGHGLLSWMLLLLARSRGHARTAVCVDATMPPSSEALATCFLDAWPELEPSWDYVEAPLICTVGAKTASGGRDSTVDCGGGRVLMRGIGAAPGTHLDSASGFSGAPATSETRTLYMNFNDAATSGGSAMGVHVENASALGFAHVAADGIRYEDAEVSPWAQLVRSVDVDGAGLVHKLVRPWSALVRFFRCCVS